MNFNPKENYWLTGHNGFIGSKIKEIANNKKLILFNISRGNILEKNRLIKKKINLKKISINKFKHNNNFFIHSAQYYIKKSNSFLNDKKILDDNLFFGIQLLEQFNKSFFDKILTIQSCLEFDKKNNNLYTYSKTLFANFCSLNYKSHIKVYLYDTFGLNDNRNKVIDFWIKKFLKNEDIPLYCDKTIINITNAELIAQALLKIKDITPKSYVFHGNVNITLGDLALLLRKLTKSNSKIINLKNNKQKPFFKYENLADKLSLDYNEFQFKNDLVKVIQTYKKK